MKSYLFEEEKEKVNNNFINIKMDNNFDHNNNIDNNEEKKSNKEKKENKNEIKKKNLINFEEYLTILIESCQGEKMEEDETKKIKKIKKYPNKRSNFKKDFLLHKYEWKRLDDIKLIELIEKYDLDWQKISKIMGKPESLIKSRYEKKLNPKLKYTKFSIEEDNLIINKYKIYGGSWNYISEFLPNRNSTMVKNRFYSSLKKRLNQENYNIKNNYQNKNESKIDENLCNKLNEYPNIFSNDLFCIDHREKKASLNENNSLNLSEENNIYIRVKDFINKSEKENSINSLNFKNSYEKEKKIKIEIGKKKQDFCLPSSYTKNNLLNCSDISIKGNPLLEEEKMDIKEINNLKNFFFENEGIEINEKSLESNMYHKMINKNNIISESINFEKLSSNFNLKYNNQQKEFEKNFFLIYTTTNSIKSPSEYIIKEIKNNSRYNKSYTNYNNNNNSDENNTFNNNINNRNIDNDIANSNSNKVNFKKNLFDNSSSHGISSNFFRKNSTENKDIFKINQKNYESKTKLEKDKMEIDEINIFSNLNLNQNNNYICYNSEEDESSLYINSIINHYASSSKSETILNNSISNSYVIKEIEVNKDRDENTNMMIDVNNSINEYSNTNAINYKETQQNNSTEEGKKIKIKIKIK